MRAPGRGWIAALVCLSNVCLSNFWGASFALAQPSDQVAAERVLGAQWKQLSRRAGMIFAGTVLGSTPPATTIDRAIPASIPAVQLSFRVDRAIAGVARGQVLTIREWAGAWSSSMQRPMIKGQHILIFLYPPSRLGLTSPVGGSLGQIALDANGKNVVERKAAAATELRDASFPRSHATAAGVSVSVVQLERAIRSARSEEE
jgi:hypothetical protein